LYQQLEIEQKVLEVGRAELEVGEGEDGQRQRVGYDADDDDDRNHSRTASSCRRPYERIGAGGRPQLRLYLSMLSVADIVFLLALLVVWLERVDVGLFTRDGWCRQVPGGRRRHGRCSERGDGWCQAVLYASRVSGFLAAWHVVVFTAERYVIVHHPLRKDSF